MAGDEGAEERGFTVVDKRGGGDAKEPEAPASAGSPDAGGRVKVDFATFCVSLGTSALYHMGMIGDPEGNQTRPEPNLPLAQQTIDTLEMLEEKTRGNLEEHEAKLLEDLLYDVRMRFVEARKAKPSAKE